MRELGKRARGGRGGRPSRIGRWVRALSFNPCFGSVLDEGAELRADWVGMFHDLTLPSEVFDNRRVEHLFKEKRSDQKAKKRMRIKRT